MPRNLSGIILIAFRRAVLEPVGTGFFGFQHRDTGFPVAGTLIQAIALFQKVFIQLHDSPLLCGFTLI
jgi:hypothetical protein